MKVKLNTSENQCSFTDEIICPYCGHVQINSWEKAPDENNDNVVCGTCSRNFYVSKWVEVTYNSIPNDIHPFKGWEVGDVSEDGLKEEDEKWANTHGDMVCEVVL